MHDTFSLAEISSFFPAMIFGLADVGMECPDLETVQFEGTYIVEKDESFNPQYPL